MSNEQEIQQFHFFASSFLYYHFDEDLLKCLEAQKRSDRQNGEMQANSCNVYKVPLPADATYRIKEFRPDVEGVEFIATIRY